MRDVCYYSNFYNYLITCPPSFATCKGGGNRIMCGRTSIHACSLVALVQDRHTSKRQTETYRQTLRQACNGKHSHFKSEIENADIAKQRKYLRFYFLVWKPGAFPERDRVAPPGGPRAAWPAPALQRRARQRTGSQCRFWQPLAY